MQEKSKKDFKNRIKAPKSIEGKQAISKKNRLSLVKSQLEKEEILAYSEADVEQDIEIEPKKAQREQDIDPNVRVTQTESLADMIPEIRQKGFEKIGIVYSDKLQGSSGRFSFVGITKDGNIEKIESMQNIDGTTTGQKITSINSRDGSLVQEEQVAGITRIKGRNSNNQEEYLSVKIGQYGIIEVDYVRADISEEKNKRYFSAPIETQNLRPTTKEVREFMDKTRNTSLKDEQKKAMPELKRDGETRIENIDDTASNDMIEIDDIIVLEDGTETTIRIEAEKDKVSPEEFLSKYKAKGGKTPDEIIKSVHEDIEQEYMRNRRHF